MGGASQGRELSIISNRNQYIDTIKGITIILMVLGHCIQYGSGGDYYLNAQYFENPLFKIIYSFHMPLFMLVSGYLFYYTMKKYSAKEVMKSRLTKVILPLFIWTTLIEVGLLTVKLIIGSVPSLSSLLIILVKQYLYSLWFLWAIFWCSVVVVVVERTLKGSIMAYVGICIISLLIPDNFNAHLYKYMFPYFIISYLWNSENLWDRIQMIAQRKRTVAVYIIILIFVGLLLLYKRDSYVYTTGITIWGKNIERQLLIDMYRWIIGLAGSASIFIVVMKLLSWLKFEKMWEYIAKIGQKSLGIYIFSGYLFAYVVPRITKSLELNYLFTLAETVVILAVSFFVTVLIEKFSITRKLFLGGR
ncbi:acyltransferase family protein [Pelosinus sp. sgz500959]|uniref:acyltransferase family protein n=1 Tax=Pelosinus sp. sgz500959 TaxID=3242472 RepID=UPI00366D6069